GTATGLTRAGPALAPGETVDYFRVSPDGAQVVANLREGGAVVFRAGDNARLAVLPHEVVAYSGDSGTLFTDDSAGHRALVYGARDLQLLHEFPLGDLPDDDLLNTRNAYVLDQSGDLLAGTNATGVAVVWNTRSGIALQTLHPELHGRILPLFGIALSPDATKLALKLPDQQLLLYDLRAPALLASQQLAPSTGARVRFSPDGTMLAVAAGSLLDAATLQPIGPKLDADFGQAMF